MWDNHRLLNQIATLLYALAGAAIAYAAVMVAIDSPLFALREVEIVGALPRSATGKLLRRELR